LYKNEEGEYTCVISLNNPTFENSAISYADGILKSTDKNVIRSKFTIQTIGASFELSGTMNFNYSDVGINTIDDVQLNIYPNPTTGELRITNYELRIKDVEVYDVLGRKEKGERKKEDIVDISHLPAGIYFIKITTEVGDQTQKVIKL
jgi:hypothetical protein